MNDPHIGEPAAQTPVTGQTKAAMASLKQSIGASGMQSLSVALGKISDSLTISINHATRQLGETTKNTKALSRLKVDVPPAKSDDVGDAARSVSTILRDVVTVDTAKVQKAASVANAQPDPTALNDFSDDMGAFYVADNRSRLSAMHQHRADVEGVKQAVDDA
jgi:hypothetical protein